MDNGVLPIACAVVFHFFAAVFALQLIRITGHKVAWICITVAIIIQLTRRLLSLFIVLGVIKEVPNIVDDSIALLISGFTLLGVKWISPVFLKIRDSEEQMRLAKLRADEEKAKTDAIIAAIGDGISIHDRDFNILYQNEVLISTFGNQTGEKCYNVYNQLNVPCDGCPVVAVFEDGAIHHSEATRPTLHGISHFEATTSPLKNAQGEIVAAIMVVRNVDSRKKMENEREILIRELEENLNKIKVLKGLLPTCAACKKIRDEHGKWQPIEKYIQDHSDAKFSHGLCHDCARKLYPDVYEKIAANNQHENNIITNK